MKSLPLLVGFLIACGGAQDSGTTTPGNKGPDAGGGAAKPAAAGDVSIELDKQLINNSQVFEPLVLNRPGMPLVEPKRRVTLAQQRSIVANARDPVLRQAQAAVLATMLYQESKTAEKEKERALWTEARQALRDAATAGGKDVDEVTWRLLGSYELLFDDFPAAEKAWQELVTRDPKDKDAPFHRAWWGLALLKQWKNAEALAVVKDEPLTDKQPELAYVTAWARWRNGDGPGAWEAILVAAKGWGTNPGREGVLFDALLIAGRIKMTFQQALPQLTAIFDAKTPAQQYDMLVKLNRSYQFAGRWTDGIATIEEALKVMGAQVPPLDRVNLRYTQADNTVRLDTPDVAVKYAKQALAALKDCAKCSEKDKQELVQAVAIMGRLFHIFYATANDLRYYQPANDLYVETIPLFTDPARRQSTNNDAETLQKTLKGTKAGTGTHTKDAIGVLVGRHLQEVQACHEAALLTNPKVSGTITVTLESDQTGVIKGVTTEPKAGLADLALVAGCTAEAAKTWNLPKRGMPGTTRIKIPFSFTPKAPAPAGPKK